MRLSVMVAVVALSVVGLSVADESRASIKRPTQIPPQPLGSALQTLAKDRGFQVVYESAQIDPLRTKGATGELTAEEALAQLLSGTGLVYKFYDDNAVSIQSRADDQQKKSLWNRLRLAQAPGGGTAQAVAVEQGGQAPPPKGPIELQEIIVTARKVVERALDVPSSMSVVSGQSMLNNGSTGFGDLVGLVPGLQYTKTAGTGSPVIRGITDGSDNSPTVAIVVDGAPFGTSSKLASGGANTLDLDPLDVAQIEVLKGPQATLYGANTLGGILSYTLIAPSLSEVESVASGMFSFAERGDPSYSFRGAVSIPVIENEVGVRFSGYRNRRGGFIDNNLLGRKDVNTNDDWGGHVALRIEPAENFRINVHGFTQRTNIDQADLVRYQTADQSKPRDGDLLYNEYLPFGVTKRISAGVVNANVDWDFADLTSVTSYQDFYIDSAINATGGALRSLLVTTLPLFGGPVLPAPGLLEIDVFGGSTKFTQELRLTSRSNGPLSWIVGGFYASERTHGNIPVFGVTTARQPIASVNPAIFFDLPSTLKEYSGFGNVTYKFASDFEVTGGLRVGSIDQTFRQRFYGTAVPAYNAFLGFFGVPQTPADTGVTRSSESVTTYLATAAWHFNADGMVYARFATGYRPGGPNVQVIGLDPTFDHDTTQNYEVGLKTRYLEQRGTLEMAGYYMPWKNIQIGVSSGGITGFGNGGDARIYGVEAQTIFKATPHLALHSALNYSQGTITHSDPGSSLVVGARLMQLPTFSGSAGFEYRTPVRGNWEGYGSVMGLYNGRRVGSAAPFVTLPEYKRVDLHAGISNPHYSVDFFVRNLNDSRAQIASFAGYGNFAFVERPRTYGVSLTVKP